MMKTRRGSVLMEMIVVFPIYLVLFGGVFMIGHMCIRPIRLSSADRTSAFDLGRVDGKRPGWPFVVEGLFHPDKEVADKGGRTDDLQVGNESEFYADTRVQGPFSARTAVTVLDNYRLPAGGARGQLAYASWFFERQPGAPQEDEWLAGILSGGSVEMRSKPWWDEGYNYYTLRRVRYPNDSKHTWRDNARPISDIVNARADKAHWYVDVYGERFQGSVGNQSSKGNFNLAADGPKDVKYERYPKFREWSN